MDVTIFDIVNEILSYKRSSYMRSEKEVQKEVNALKSLNSHNAKVYRQRSKLKKEQKASTSKFRRMEIEEELSKLKTVSTRSQINFINMISGKDFYFIVDNGFKQKAYLRSEIISQPEYYQEKFLKDMAKDIKAEIKKQRAEFDKLTKTATMQELARRERIIRAMNKLVSKVKTNIAVLKSGDESMFDGEAGEGGDKMSDESNFPISAEVIGETIRLNL